MQTDPTQAMGLAEAEALEAEARERAAYERFDAARDSLRAQEKAHEATQGPEFRTWMAARAATDEAWGRWAMARETVDAAG